jgi:hypothetical protein
VEITLAPVADGTEVRLRHAGLPAGEPPLAHVAGWRHTLAFAGAADQLARCSASVSPTGWPPGTSPTRPGGPRS